MFEKAVYPCESLNPIIKCFNFSLRVSQIQYDIISCYYFYCDDKKSYVIFRIFQAYGPGQQINFLIPTILSQLSLDMKYKYQ